MLMVMVMAMMMMVMMMLNEDDDDDDDDADNRLFSADVLCLSMLVVTTTRFVSEHYA